MTIRNKVLITFFLEPDCIQEDDEVRIEWAPINFRIYSDLFPNLIDEATHEWLANRKLVANYVHEVVFAHVVERDGAGAVTDEYFEPIHHEMQKT